MKLLKISAACLAAALVLVVLFSCGTDNVGSGKPTVVATSFPGYDFARAVCGNAVETVLLVPPGNSSHSYEPTAKDMIKISQCGLFVCDGSESESWAEKLIDSLDNDVPVFKMADACHTETQTSVKSGSTDGENVHSGHDHDDEHVWTSPVNAILIVSAIRDRLSELYPEYADEFSKNADGYISSLRLLDGEFRDMFASAKTKTLVFGDRFPFACFAEKYGLDCHSAFPGCAEETEPSAAVVASLIEMVKSEKITTVFCIEFSNRKIADAISDATGAVVKMLHSCHSVTEDQLKSGITYIDLMKENLETLRGALN
ncbi:MAG: metal ABC transporter substrate-binding protein [Firmicutes bacterium]|nr:metal ABC transporter substrate-binding protein [Bacillota bacterium]